MKYATCSPLPTHQLALCRDERVLGAAIADFLGHGLADGAGAIVVTGSARWDQARSALGAAGEAALASGALVFLEAADALEAMLDRGLSSDALSALVGPHLERLRAITGHRRVYAYGDMVDVLWQRRQPDLAARLEGAWHELMTREPITLLCGYTADPLDEAYDAAELMPLCCAHGRVAAVEDEIRRASAIERALDEVMDPAQLGRLEVVLAAEGLPTGSGGSELTMLWLRTQMPHLGSRILHRARGLLATGAVVG